MAINLLAIALNLFRNNAAIKVLAKKRRPDTSALKKIIETGKAKKLTKRQAKQAEDLEDIADAKYGRSREKGVNLTRLLASIDRTRRKNALRDKVTIVSLKKGRNGSILSKSLTYDKTGSRLVIRPHKHVLKQVPTNGEPKGLPISKSKRIIAICDCEDFSYRFQYALTTRFGCSEITRDEINQYPVATNPGLVLGACKHIFVLGNYCKQRGI